MPLMIAPLSAVHSSPQTMTDPTSLSSPLRVAISTRPPNFSSVYVASFPSMTSFLRMVPPLSS